MPLSVIPQQRVSASDAKARAERIAGWLLISGVIVVGAISLLGSERGAERTATFRTLLSYWARPANSVTLQDASRFTQRHDPVFYQNATGDMQFAGYVQTVRSTSTGESEVTLQWCLPAVAPESLSWQLYRNQGRFSDLVQVLLPAEKRIRIEQQIRVAVEQHGAELAEQLFPVLETSLRQALPAIESAVRQSVRKHRNEFNRLGQRWNETVVHERLVPLTTQRLLPIVRKHGEPVAREVGQELWQRASIWRFGWRLAYDKSPLPQKDLTSQEWDRFVTEEAIPVFESHADEISEAVQASIVEIANDVEVRHELASAAEVMASDPESQRLLKTILQEAFVENKELHRIWRDAWTSAQAARALETVGKRLEPVVRSIGDELLGTREGGIEPGFARLLRNQILNKDQRWLIAQPSATASPSIQLASQSMPFPLPAFTGRNLVEPDADPSRREPGRD